MSVTFKAFTAIYLARADVYNADKTLEGKIRYCGRFVKYFRSVPLGKIGRAEIEGYTLFEI